MKTFNKELFYESIAEEWEQKMNKPERNKRMKVVYKILLDKIPLKGKKLLDVGCGLGHFSLQAGELGAEVYGVDVGKKKIDKNLQEEISGRKIFRCIRS